MTVKSLVCAATVGMLCAGCAGNTYWKKPGLDQNVFRQDSAQCVMYANGQASSYMAMAGGDPYAGMFGALTSPAVARKQFAFCMEAKGYEQVEKPEGAE